MNKEEFKSSSEYTRDEDSDDDRIEVESPVDIDISSNTPTNEGDLEAMTYDEALMLLGGFGKA